jgi:dolichol-phosphate mannosyltransferase
LEDGNVSVLFRNKQLKFLLAMHYFIVLAYNEEQNLPRLFTSLKEKASLLNGPFKIVLVNDGSTDRTVAVAEEFQKVMPIHIEHHPKNLGVGQGFRTGFRSALSSAKDGDIIFTLEADNTGDLSLLLEMQAKINAGADIVLASCYAPRGAVRGLSFERKVMSSGINLVMRILFPIKGCHTYSSFYRGYRSAIVKQAASRFGERFIQSDGFTVAAEILFKMRRLHATMDEIPMVLQFDERKGRSKMKVWKTIMDYLSFLLREVTAETRFRLRGNR